MFHSVKFGTKKLTLLFFFIVAVTKFYDQHKMKFMGNKIEFDIRNKVENSTSFNNYCTTQLCF